MTAMWFQSQVSFILAPNSAQKVLLAKLHKKCLKGHMFNWTSCFRQFSGRSQAVYPIFNFGPLLGHNSAVKLPRFVATSGQFVCFEESWLVGGWSQISTYIIRAIGRSYWGATRGNWHIPQVMIRHSRKKSRDFRRTVARKFEKTHRWSFDWMRLPRNPAIVTWALNYSLSLGGSYRSIYIYNISRGLCL